VWVCDMVPLDFPLSSPDDRSQCSTAVLDERQKWHDWCWTEKVENEVRSNLDTATTLPRKFLKPHDPAPRLFVLFAVWVAL
jgi:hypothetical protein